MMFSKVADSRPSCWISTYKTNRDSLLLGCIGAAGLLSQARSLPSVRMIPGFFVLANSEDEAAHIVLLDPPFVEHAKK